ncbi:hypothetical protein RQP54_14385 [Curvibacter sp. APW13]|uniref:hypothetical protein n=1 Tax=Curvibacter sp. APW13 TaxID=3077236 RepID=UPI0028DE4703|nr:hypothetical protein [Curvibacter sp. APW13]MDT8992057.1 hypothetical protein [Curvibacter sp. APW13]
MPTVISFFLAPLCVLLAVYRLVSIPLQVLRGQREFNRSPSLAPAIWAAVAYVGLVGYLVWIIWRMVQGFTATTLESWEVLRVLLYFEAFPVVYVLAESRFFYGFKRQAKAA